MNADGTDFTESRFRHCFVGEDMVRYSSVLAFSLRAEQGETGCPGGAGNRSLKISNWRLGISALAITETGTVPQDAPPMGRKKRGVTVRSTVRWNGVSTLLATKLKKGGGAPQRGPGDQEIGCTPSAKSTPGLNALSLLDSGMEGGGAPGSGTVRSPGDTESEPGDRRDRA